MNANRFIIALLLIGLLLSDCALLLALVDHDLQWPHPAVVTMVGWLLAQLTLVGLCFIQPRINIAIKTTFAIITHLAISHAIAWLTHGNASSWGVALACYLILTSGLLWGIRLLLRNHAHRSVGPNAARLQPDSSASSVESRPLQISLLGVMSLTTAVCLLMGYGSRFQATSDLLFPSLTLFGFLSLASTSSLWLALRARIGISSGIAIILFVVASLWYSIMDVEGLDTVSMYYLVLTQQLGVQLLGVLLRAAKIDVFGLQPIHPDDDDRESIAPIAEPHPLSISMPE